MNNIGCTICKTEKAHLNCTFCNDKLCKSCAFIIDEDSFEFISEVPSGILHSISCNVCYFENVEPLIENHKNILERAKGVYVYGKEQGKETRLFKRKKGSIQVVDEPDHNRAILHLAFLTIQSGCNAMVDVEMKSKKVKSGSYQTTLWSGVAKPVLVDPQKIERYIPTLDNPN